jgi:hypothetical protein
MSDDERLPVFREDGDGRRLADRVPEWFKQLQRERQRDDDRRRRK